MRIELTWPRANAEARTLTIAVPDIGTLLTPTLRRARQACTPAVLRRAAAYAEPVVTSAAGATGAGVLVQLALPFAVRLAQQALDGTAPTGEAAGSAG